MSVAARLACALVAVASVTRAAHASPDRVVLADPDPELRRAVETSLAPWHLEVVVDPDVPADETAAHARAEITGARFVVWREGDQLVVFDRDRDQAERRPTRAGAFDPVGGAAAALTVKTLMRLPPLAERPALTVAQPTPPPPPTTEGGVEVRLQLGLAARVTPGSDAGLGGRFVIAAMVRPSQDLELRIGLVADRGSSAAIDRGGFKGTWSDLAALAAASWTLPIGAWEVEPWLAAGVNRGALAGTEMTTSRSEHATTAALRAGVWVRRRLGAWTAAAGLDLEVNPGAPTYTRSTAGQGTPAVFEAPSFSVVTGLAVAADLGR